MTINLRRSHRRVKVSSKFNETYCALKDRMNDQQVLPGDELECVKSNNDKEIGENSRVCGSDDDVSSGRKVNNDDDERMNEETVILKEKMQSNNSINHSTTKNNVSSSPNQVNVQDETIKTWYGSGDNASYADKVIQSATNDNKLEHIPTLNENGREFVIFDDVIINEGILRPKIGTTKTVETAPGHSTVYQLAESSVAQPIESTAVQPAEPAVLVDDPSQNATTITK
ncbi:hypothetical protein Tco_0935890 [Tanacetum coccineum]